MFFNVSPVQEIASTLRFHTQGLGRKNTGHPKLSLFLLTVLPFLSLFLLIPCSFMSFLFSHSFCRFHALSG